MSLRNVLRQKAREGVRLKEMAFAATTPGIPDGQAARVFLGFENSTACSSVQCRENSSKMLTRLIVVLKTFVAESRSLA